MRISTDVIQTLNENGIDVSSAWMWCIQDIYDQSYRQVLEQPISLESLTLDFCRWKTNIADITIRVSNDANSDVLWAGEAALIDDSAYTPDPVVNQPIIYPSTGMIGTKPSIVDNGNGTITIGAGTAILRQDTTTYSNLLQYNLSSATYTIPQDSQTYYICAKYNNGTAAYYLEVLEGNINAKTIIPVYAVWNILGTLSYQYFGANGDLLANKIDYALVDTVPYKISLAGGLIISENNLVWSATGAIVYAGTTPIQISAITASSSNLIKAYTVNGVWNYSTGTATYDNTNYDNGTNVIALGTNKYAVRWIFRSMSSPDQLLYVMGLTQYSTAASAEDEPLRTDLPELITKHAMLIAKAIVRSGASAGVTESTINTSFSGGAISSNHNSLGGIYGDSPFYHLSLGAYTQINNINNLSGTGLLKITNNVPSLDTNSYQPLKSILTSIGNLSTVSTGLLKITNGVASFDTNTYLTTASAASTYQPLKSILTSIGNLSTASTGLLKLTNGVASFDTNTYLTSSTAASNYQPLNSILTSISGLSTTSTGVLKLTNGVTSLDSSTYLTTASAASTYLPLAGGTLNTNAIVSLSGAAGGGFITQYANSSYPNDLRTSALSSGYVEFGYNGAMYTRFSFIGSDNTGYVKLYGSGNSGTLMVNKLVISGGTSSQFLMADGSLNSTQYLTSSSLSGYLTQTTFNSGNPDLAAIEALTGTSGLLRKTAANTWSLDTNSYWYTSNHPTTLANYGINYSDALFDNKYLQISNSFSSYVASFNVGVTGTSTRYVKLAQLPTPTIVAANQANINMTVYAANNYSNPTPTATMVSFSTRGYINLINRSLNSATNNVTYGYVTNGNYVELWAILGAFSGAFTVEVNSCTQGSYGLLSDTTTNPGITTVTSVSMYDDRYLQGNQSISLSGVITGSGTTSIATSFANSHLAGINQDLSTSSTVAFAQVYINPKSNGLYIFGSETNPITNVFHDNSNITTNAPVSAASIRNALQFNWYGTDWEIGNIRGGGTDTQGFGIACDAGANLRWRVTNGTTYDYNALSVSGGITTTSLTASSAIYSKYATIDGQYFSTSYQYAGFGHKACTAAGNYCLLQDSSGVSYLNGASTLHLQINNADVVNITSASTTVSNTLIANGGITGNLTGTASNASALNGLTSDYYVQGTGYNSSSTFGRRTTCFSYNNTTAASDCLTTNLASGFYDGYFSAGQTPNNSWAYVMNISHSNSLSTSEYQFQLAASFDNNLTSNLGGENYWVRTINTSGVGAWRTLIHSANYTAFNQYTSNIYTSILFGISGYNNPFLIRTGGSLASSYFAFGSSGYVNRSFATTLMTVYGGMEVNDMLYAVGGLTANNISCNGQFQIKYAEKTANYTATQSDNGGILAMTTTGITITFLAGSNYTTGYTTRIFGPGGSTVASYIYFTDPVNINGTAYAAGKKIVLQNNIANIYYTATIWVVDLA